MINLQFQILRKVVDNKKNMGKQQFESIKFFKQEVPRSLNLADITPVYKKSKKKYQPVSNLPIVSKIL